MKDRILLFIIPMAMLAVAGFVSNVSGQSIGGEKVRDGVYELTLKTPDSRTIVIDKMVRDRDLDPKSIYRVATGGYLAFDESEWVDKIEFKVFDIPVSQMPEYRRLSKTLVDINDKLSSIKGVLHSYDELAFRLMNICDKSKFPNLQAIDQNIIQQLSIYKRLILLRSLVVNSLNRFVKRRSCVDRFEGYQDDLKLYTKRLTDLCRNYDRLRRDVLSGARRMSEKPKTSSSKTLPDPQPKGKVQ
jgi:hypothetical protein